MPNRLVCFPSRHSNAFGLALALALIIETPGQLRSHHLDTTVPQPPESASTVLVLAFHAILPCNVPLHCFRPRSQNFNHALLGRLHCPDVVPSEKSRTEGEIVIQVEVTFSSFTCEREKG